VNLIRLFLAALAAFVVYFAFGFLTFGMLPALKSEFLKYPAIYRSQEAIKSVMPIGMAAMFVAMLALTWIYSLLYKGGSGLIEGARFGVLIGLFCVCSFVIHNYVNLNIGGRLTIAQSLAYFVEWVVVGIAIGLVYRPALVR
jgi:hypothetical protein